MHSFFCLLIQLLTGDRAMVTVLLKSNITTIIDKATTSSCLVNFTIYETAEVSMTDRIIETREIE